MTEYDITDIYEIFTGIALTKDQIAGTREARLKALGFSTERVDTMDEGEKRLITDSALLAGLTREDLDKVV